MSNESTSNFLELASRCFKRGDYRGAISWYQQAAVFAHQRGEPDNEMLALANLSTAQGNLGEFEIALESATRMLMLARQVDNRDREMSATELLVRHLASIDLHIHWSDIRKLLLNGLLLARQLNNNYQEVKHLSNLGAYANAMNEQAQALSWLQDALSAMHPGMENEIFCHFDIYSELSDLMQRRGDKSEALRYAEMSLGAARELSNPDFISFALRQLAWIQYWHGELSEALALTEEALEIRRQLNLEYRIVTATTLKIELLVALGLHAAAWATYHDLVASCFKADNLLTELGKVLYRAFNDLDGAEQAYRSYLQKQPKKASAWNDLALILYDKGHIEESVHCWREALKIRDGNADALAGLALGLWTIDQCNEAVKVFRQAVNLEPQYLNPIWLADRWRDNLPWSQKTIDAARPMIMVAQLSADEQSKGTSV